MSYPDYVTRGMVDVMAHAIIGPVSYGWDGRDALHKLSAMRCETYGLLARCVDGAWTLTNAGRTMLAENGKVFP